MTKIGIVGSRRRDTPEDKDKIRQTLLRIIGNACQMNCVIDRDIKENFVIVSGGCPKGADKFAEELNDELGFPNKPIIHYPDKSKLDPVLMRKNPRAAFAVINYARNTLIAEDSDILIACVAPDRKGGTEDTIKKYLKLGKDALILV